MVESQINIGGVDFGIRLRSHDSTYSTFRTLAAGPTRSALCLQLVRVWASGNCWSQAVVLHLHMGCRLLQGPAGKLRSRVAFCTPWPRGPTGVRGPDFISIQRRRGCRPRCTTNRQLSTSGASLKFKGVMGRLLRQTHTFLGSHAGHLTCILRNTNNSRSLLSGRGGGCGIPIPRLWGQCSAVFLQQPAALYRQPSDVLSRQEIPSYFLIQHLRAEGSGQHDATQDARFGQLHMNTN